MNERIHRFIGVFRSLSFRGIRGRMIAMSATPVILMVLVVSYVFFQVGVLSKDLNNVIDNMVPAVTTSKELSSEINTASRYLWSAYLFRKEPAPFSANVTLFERAVERMKSARERYLQIPMNARAETLRKEAETLLKELDPVSELILKMFNEKRADDVPTLANEKLMPGFKKLEDIFSNIEMNNADTIEAEKEYATRITKKAWTSIVFGSLFAVLASILFSVLYSEKIASALGEICKNLSRESNSTKSQSASIAASSKELAESSTRAASALQETAAAIEETSAMIQKNANNANQSSAVSRESVEQVDAGKNSMNDIKAAVNGIKAASADMQSVVGESNNQFSDILKIINEIGQKTQLINDIVFQTKLLSFNASVEAARAGEQGKGFAVVAEEVGKLARSSGSASDEISTLLDASKSRVQGIVEQTKQSMGGVTETIQLKVNASEAVVGASVELLEKIAEKSKEVNRLVDEIASASVEQSNGVAEIGKSMHELDQVSNQNMSAGQQIANSSQQLLKQSESLDQIVGELAAIIEGKAV